VTNGMKPTSTVLQLLHVPVIVVRFLLNLNFLDTFSKKKKYSKVNFQKSAQWEPRCYMGTYGRTDMTKLTVTLSNVANAPKSTC
jgi:hypothetical protein